MNNKLKCDWSFYLNGHAWGVHLKLKNLVVPCFAEKYTDWHWKISEPITSIAQGVLGWLQFNDPLSNEQCWNLIKLSLQKPCEK